MNLSFAGCGFLGIYHVGVACCFRKYAPHLLLNKISGASAGAIAACCLLCDLPLGDLTSNVLRAATEARKKSLGPLSPSYNINNLLLEGLEKYLPDDAHIRVSGRLHISMTRVCDGKNVIVSQFDSREELIQALLASAFIPIVSGIWPPKFRGYRYMDGGCSDNLPTIDENTITVSPFCGESDICPRDDSSQLFHINVANTSIELSKHNMYRIARILFPPKPEVLSNMCKQGFDDALRFLHRNNLINCTRCLAVHSTFAVSEKDENLEYDPQCQECVLQRQEALVSNMPDTVISIFQEAIEKANKGLLNWLFKHRGMKLLSVLSLPYTVPADLVYATITKFMSAAPQLGNSVWEASKYCMDQMGQILSKANRSNQQMTAQISCQLDITEYGNNFEVESCQDYATQNKMNVNFTLNIDDSSEVPPAETSTDVSTVKKTIQKQKPPPSITIDACEMGADAFDNILRVTSQHETIMSYYYLDENNTVQVTEIFDVTESDSPIVQTAQEKDVNKALEFDDEDWGATHWDGEDEICANERKRSLAEISEYSLEDILDKDTNLFSDPESEWIGTFKVEEPEDDVNNSYSDSKNDSRPESDQPIPVTNESKNNYRLSFVGDD
ncbi:patatin-like phospholipase domain-containing protein 2 isoform X2 [Coccinella septempunctata]|uniref:patatin-like phospholipase domain-containing protein 2 isoform X2 n=1 Tax=Coccinella septempunctata TaxID=41139 RepID=UPI001D07903E|nr:patatin-like phospholipase domain-containing protein 2 isoform X2 [Coccinella septempunctata]